MADVPVITAEFAAGRMSYAKVRALTRIANAATEAGLAKITGPMTAAQCERFVAAHRTASGSKELASRAARLVSVHVGEDGSVTISAKLPATDGAVVLQALRAAAGDCEHPHRPHPGPAEDTPPAGRAGDVPAETRADESRAREHHVSAETSDDGPADLATDPAHRSAGHPAHPARCHLDDQAA